MTWLHETEHVERTTQRRGRAPGLLARALGALALCLALGCDGETGMGGGSEVEHGQATVGGGVVSTVDGEPITLAEVEELVRKTKLEPREALRRLQSERLLMREAQRRDVASRSIDDGTRRALVQAFLDAEAAAVSVSEAELRKAHAEDPRFVGPERRASYHVLAKVKSKATAEQDAAAKAFAKSVIEEFRREEPRAVHQRYSRTKVGDLEVKSDAIGPTPRKGGLVDEYLTALYSVPGPGVVPEPVRTRFGWHAVFVTEVLPPFEKPFEEAAPILREEILLRKREAHVQELLAELHAKHRVSIEQDVRERLGALPE